jgi:ferric-dicitrate binding protein FerR (iron transport regulator)
MMEIDQSPDDDRGDSVAKLVRAAGRRPTPRHEDYERVLAVSHAAWRRKVVATRRRRWLYALAAAAALAAVAVGSLPLTRSKDVGATLTVARGQVERSTAADGWVPLDGTDAPITTRTMLRTAADGQASFRLASGASLRIDRATEWRFAASGALELTRGRLYVDTAGTDSRVEVATPFGAVSDLGTQFEVRATDVSLRLRVREGSVRFAPAGDGAALEGHAGQQVEWRGDDSVDIRSFGPDDGEWAWAMSLAEPLEIDGRTAFEALSWVARETGKRLVFEDATAELHARNAILAGNARDLSPLQILEVVVATSSGLDYTLRDGAIIVRRR